MEQLIFLGYAAAFAFLNAAAGRKFFGLTESTQLSRILFALGGGALAGFFAASGWIGLGVAIGLYLWRLSGWGDFFVAAGGVKANWRSTGDAKWVCWLSDKIWPIDPKEGMELRLKATLDMAIRQSLIVPTVLFYAVATGDYWLALNALAFPLMGIAYFLNGFVPEALRKNGSLMVAEALGGVVIASMLWRF
jgi:hypothetical protein